MEELIPIVMFMCIAGVMILRPITKRLGGLLEAMAEERRAALRPGGDERTAGRVVELLDRLNTRLELLEDRMHYVERLSDGRREGAQLRASAGERRPGLVD